MIVALTLAAAHVPFFVNQIAVVERDLDVSQVYYFKRSGTIYSVAKLDSTVSVIGPTKSEGSCFAMIDCDENVTKVPFLSESRKEEPFTQSEYYVYFEEKKKCGSFVLKAVCNSPWAAVVGEKEEFYLLDLLAMPAVIARIHGSWWNKQYIVGWLLLVFLPILCLLELDGKRYFLYSAIAVSLAFMIDKVVATATYADTSVLAWIISFSELLIVGAAVALLHQRSKRVAGAVILFAIVSFFLFGLGFFLGSMFLLVGGILSLMET